MELSVQAAFRGHLTALCHPYSSSSSSSLIPFGPSTISKRTLTFRNSHFQVRGVSRFWLSRKLGIGCRASEAETEPGKHEDKEEVVHKQADGEKSGSLNHSVENNVRGKEQNQRTTLEALESLKNRTMNASKGDITDQDGAQGKEQNQRTTLEALDSLKNSTVNASKGEISDQDGAQGKEQNQRTTLEALDLLKNSTVNASKGEISDQDGAQDVDAIEVASGSPLPGLKPQQLDESARIPKEVIDILRNEVFGFDTFFITGQEPYEGGVLFKGNLRGKSDKSFEKLSNRMQDKFGDQYKIFLLINPEDDKPVVVVVPKMTLQPETTAVPEWFAAGAFGLVTVFTLLLRNVPALQSNLLSTFDDLELLKNGLPGALVTTLILGAHELGHYIVAKDCGVKLGVPYFVPSWQIGSFGAITRIVNIVPKRENLLKVAAAGPLAGFSLGLLLFLLGFILPPSDGIGIIVDASVFHESFLAGGIAKLLLGDALKEGIPLSVNPLVIWSWAGLLINAINSIPAGELDGGRIAFAIWGRKASTRITGASIALLGLSALFNDVAFYWVALIFFLQRGPIAPNAEEITDPDNKYIALGVAVLVLGLLVCLPYPFVFSNDATTTF